MNIYDIIKKEDLGEPYDRLYDILDLCEIIKLEQVYGGRQIHFRRRCENPLNEYPELFYTLGHDAAMKVFKTLCDMRVYFPAIRQSALAKIKRQISAEFNGYNHAELARKYGYTERHIRNIVGRGGSAFPPCSGQLTLDTTVL